MQPTQAKPTPQLQASTPVLFAVLLLVDSLHFIFARALLPLVPPTTSAMYVLLIGALQVGIFGVVTRRLQWTLAAVHWRFFLVVGLFVAASTALNYAAVVKRYGNEMEFTSFFFFRLLFTGGFLQIGRAHV